MTNTNQTNKLDIEHELGSAQSQSKSQFSWTDLGKGSKIKLIIFAEFSAKGGGDPPSVKIIIFFPPKK